MYPIVSDNWELELPHGVQPVDGVEGARLAVRQQVAHGADWIKYYSDAATISPRLGADSWSIHGRRGTRDRGRGAPPGAQVAATRSGRTESRRRSAPA